MKKLIFLLIASSTLTSCIFFNGEETVVSGSTFIPVYIQRTTFENSIAFEQPKNSLKSGKIYIQNQIMYLNDVNKGFQIYNYTNPANPIKIGYIKVPGATDVAIRNNILYINQATDLVTINLNLSTNTLIQTSRIKNAFPPKLSPDGFYAEPKQNQIVIDWIN